MSWFSSIQEQAAQALSNVQAEVEKLSAQVVEKVHSIDAEIARNADEEGKKGSATLMPWEFKEDGKVRSDPKLMQRILELSLREDTFAREPPSDFAFRVEDHVRVIERLLDVDAKLAEVQGNHSANMDEQRFWSSYFFECEKLRQEALVDAEYEQVEVGADDLEDDAALVAAIEAELAEDEASDRGEESSFVRVDKQLDDETP